MCPLVYYVVHLVYLSVFVCLSAFKDLTMKLSLIQSVGLIARAISECVKKQGYVFSRKQELINVMLVSADSFKVC